jgi:hypothetical protein
MPLSTKFPARSVAVGGEISASLGKRQLIVLLISAAATEFLFVAIAAYVAAIVYHRLILTSSVDPAKYIPEALLIAPLDLLVSIGHLFPNSAGSSTATAMARRNAWRVSQG